MKKKQNIIIKDTTFLLIIVFLIFPKPAYAYLDPGTGSFMIQMLIAAVAGFGFVFRSYWKKIISNFKKKNDNKEE